jgi:hypothetical protein
MIYEKFKTIMGLAAPTDNENNSIIFLPREIAQREIADKRGENRTEFIHVWRNSTKRDFQRQRTPVARTGMYTHYTDGTKEKVAKLITVPALLEYEIGFWSLSLDKLQAVVEEYFFWIHQNPNLAFTFDGQYPMEIDLHFGDITDMSTIADTYNTGRLFLYTCPLTVEAWLPRAATERTILRIIVKGYSRETGMADQLLFEFTIPEV